MMVAASAALTVEEAAAVTAGRSVLSLGVSAVEIETKFEFLPCCSRAFALRILHLRTSGGMGVRGGSAVAPITWLLGIGDGEEA